MSIELLFVCTGNTCRSPMAEALVAPLAQAAGIPAGCIRAGSAGVSASDGEPASSEAVAVMAELGIDISSHRSRRLTPELIEGADLVLAMERRHLDAVLQMAPGAAGRARSLAADGIADPYMSSVDVYRYTRDQIADALRAVLSHMGDRSASE